MSNSIYFKWFVQAMNTEKAKEYSEMSINQQKDMYIKYLEAKLSNI